MHLVSDVIMTAVVVWEPDYTHLYYFLQLWNFSRFISWYENYRFLPSSFVEKCSTTETWLDNSICTSDISSYNCVHHHKVNRTGGGVGIYLLDHLGIRHRADLAFSGDCARPVHSYSDFHYLSELFSHINIFLNGMRSSRLFFSKNSRKKRISLLNWPARPLSYDFC